MRGTEAGRWRVLGVSIYADTASLPIKQFKNGMLLFSDLFLLWLLSLVVYVYLSLCQLLRIKTFCLIMISLFCFFFVFYLCKTRFLCLTALAALELNSVDLSKALNLTMIILNICFWLWHHFLHDSSAWKLLCSFIVFIKLSFVFFWGGLLLLVWSFIYFRCFVPWDSITYM